MKLEQAGIGTYVRRNITDKDIVIFIHRGGVFLNCRYCHDRKKYVKQTILGHNSPLFYDDDFEYCDEAGNFIYPTLGPELTKEQEKAMKPDVNYIGGDYKVVEVSYSINPDEARGNMKAYHFKCDIDIEVERGDYLVVEDRNGINLVRAVSVYENCMENAKIVANAKAWIVDKVDMSRQEERRVATERRQYIIQQLEEKQKQIDAISVYKMLADIDPEAKKLVEELKTLTLK